MRDERALREMRPPRGDRYPLSLLTPSQPASRLDPAAEDYAEAYTGDDDDAKRLEAILSFNARAHGGTSRGSSRRWRSWSWPRSSCHRQARLSMQSLVHRASPGVSGPSGQTPAQTAEPSRTPAVADKMGASGAPENPAPPKDHLLTKNQPRRKSPPPRKDRRLPSTPSRAPAVERCPDRAIDSSAESARRELDRNSPRERELIRAKTRRQRAGPRRNTRRGWSRRSLPACLVSSSVASRGSADPGRTP